MNKLRKHTKFQTCERHDWLNGETRYRRAEFFLEGGPTDGPCQGGICRLWPGTDLISDCWCTREFELDWAVNRTQGSAMTDPPDTCTFRYRSGQVCGWAQYWHEDSPHPFESDCAERSPVSER
jgi:hypothetical protein